jgi:hypothetical protein
MNSSILVPIIVSLVIFLVIFLILREVVLWYFKINKIIEGLSLQVSLLRKILVQLGGTVETKQNSTVPDKPEEDLTTYDYLDDKGRVRNVTAKTAEHAGWTRVKK